VLDHLDRIIRLCVLGRLQGLLWGWLKDSNAKQNLPVIRGHSNRLRGLAESFKEKRWEKEVWRTSKKKAY